MASFTGSSIKNVYKDILHTSNSNTGLSTTIKQITCGDGDTTSLHLSDRNLKIQPAADSTTNTAIYDADGNVIFTVDTTNDLVKTGVGQHIVNTQYQYFGWDNQNATTSAGYHYAVSLHNRLADAAYLRLGNGTDPATSYAITDDAHEVLNKYWHILDNITLDNITWWVGADASTGDTIRMHLMQYDVVTVAGATSGDLSSGIVLAAGADIVNAGKEQAYYQQVTPSTANVDAGKIILFTFDQDTVNSDYTINATVKYHLR